jgi:hypothetical protein
MDQILKNIIRTHIAKAVSRVDVSRYSQEPAYVNAVLARIDGLVYEGAYGHVELKSTVVNDRGPNSAESKYGADFAITAIIESAGTEVEKAIIGQAKKGRIEELNRQESERLQKQVAKMASHTNQYVILEVPELYGNSPRIRLPYQIRPDQYKYPMSLEDYISSQLVQCLHGDRRGEFVSAVQDSSLSRLSIIVRT